MSGAAEWDWWRELHAAIKEGDSEVLRSLISPDSTNEESPRPESEESVASSRSSGEGSISDRSPNASFRWSVSIHGGDSVSSQSGPSSVSSLVLRDAVQRADQEKEKEKENENENEKEKEKEKNKDSRLSRKSEQFDVEILQKPLSEATKSEVWGFLSGDQAKAFDELIERSGLDANCLVDNGTSILRSAVQMDAVACADVLLRRGALPLLCSEGEECPFLLAVRTGNLAMTKLFLDRGVSPDGNADGVSPVWLACVSRRVDIVKLLLERGGSSSWSDDYGMTPLHFAARTGDDEMTAVLLSAGADVCAGALSGQTALHLAASDGHNPLVIQALLNAGARVETKNSVGETALHWACRSQNVSMARRLCDSGADPTTPNAKGVCPLLVAINCDCEPLVRELLNATRKCSMPVNLSRFLWFAVLGARQNAAKALLEEGASPADCPEILFPPSKHGDVDMISELLSCGAKVDAVDLSESGWRSLHWAAFCGQLDAVKLLLEAGAEVDASTADGQTPLMLAVSARYESVALFLVECGRANVNCVHPKVDGWSVLGESVGFMSESSVGKLIRCGAEVNRSGSQVESPLMRCVRRKRAPLAQMLILAKADLECGLDEKERGDRPLHVAASLDDPDLIEMLILGGARADVLNEKGKTPMQVAKPRAGLLMVRLGLVLRIPTLESGSGRGSNRNSAVGETVS